MDHNTSEEREKEEVVGRVEDDEGVGDVMDVAQLLRPLPATAATATLVNYLVDHRDLNNSYPTSLVHG